MNLNQLHRKRRKIGNENELCPFNQFLINNKFK